MKEYQSKWRSGVQFEVQVCDSSGDEISSPGDLPESMRHYIENGVTRLYLEILNRYALNHGLISQETYRAMQVKFSQLDLDE